MSVCVGGGGGVEGRVSKAHHYEFLALQRRGLAGDKGQMITNYFPHGAGNGDNQERYDESSSGNS